VDTDADASVHAWPRGTETLGGEQCAAARGLWLIPILSASRERWVSPTALRGTVPAALVFNGPVLLGGLRLAAALGR
jgi:hypothetical protein